MRRPHEIDWIVCSKCGHERSGLVADDMKGGEYLVCFTCNEYDLRDEYDAPCEAEADLFTLFGLE